MAKGKDRDREALRRARQRLRQAEQTAPVEAPRVLVPGPSTPEVRLRRMAATTCAWCDGPLERKARGRIPKWCSAACRQRAWEQKRAAESGRSAVEVVERRVEIPVRSAAPPPLPQHGEWVAMLSELTSQLDRGAIYSRDLDDLTPVVERLVASMRRRLKFR